MPIYEFLCAECQRKFRKLIGMTANPAPLVCPRCQSDNAQRLISRFTRGRSEDDTLDALANDMEAIGDENDPKTLQRMMKEVSSAMGEDLDDDFEQVIEETTREANIESDA